MTHDFDILGPNRRRAAVISPGAANLVLAAAIVLALALCAILTQFLVVSYHDTLRRAEIADQNLSRAIEQTLMRNFILYDAPLRAMQGNPGPINNAIAQRSGGKEFTLERATVPREVEGIYVLNAAGDMTLNLFAPIPWQPSYADSDYFVVQRQDPARGLYVSEPFKSRLTGSTEIALSRRLNHADGSFAGVAVITIDLASFDTIFAGLKTGRLSHMNLFRDDGLLLDTYPDRRRPVGVAIGATPNFTRMQRSRVGSFVAPAALDGVRRLYSFRRIGDLPLIFTTAHSVDDIFSGWIRRAVILGGVAVLFAGLSIAIAWWWRRELRRVHELHRLLGPQALSDPLTQLPNGACFDAQLVAEIKATANHNLPLTLLMIDVDFLKAYNAQYGYRAGDAALIRLAEHCRAAANSGDVKHVVARSSRNRFVILLRGTAIRPAELIADGIRQQFAFERISHRGSHFGVLTISIGVAALADELDQEGRALMNACDNALVQAKHAGHNQVCLHQGRLPPQALGANYATRRAAGA